MKPPKQAKVEFKKISSWWYIRIAVKAWLGGEYPLYSFSHQKGRKMKINAHEGIVKQTQAVLAKNQVKKEELESKLRSLKDDLDQKWKTMESELK